MKRYFPSKIFSPYLFQLANHHDSQTSIKPVYLEHVFYLHIGILLNPQIGQEKFAAWILYLQEAFGHMRHTIQFYELALLRSSGNLTHKSLRKAVGFAPAEIEIPVMQD